MILGGLRGFQNGDGEETESDESQKRGKWRGEARARKGVSGKARRVATDWRAAPREGAMCNRSKMKSKNEGIRKFSSS